MSTITSERLRDVLDYDAETGLFKWRRTLSARAQAGATAGSKSYYGYREIRVDRLLHGAHRLAWLYVHGTMPTGQIDHINGDKADNRISNLRDVPARVNQQNRRRSQANNKLGLLGVCKPAGSNRYTAQIKVDGKRRTIGTFSTAEAASEAYLRAKRASHEGCTV